MVKIKIDDDIAWWGISDKNISEQLSNLQVGEEVEIEINSPGGSVYEGIAIFNTIYNIAETHPVHVWIKALAASMASYIAIAARLANRNLKITVNENSIFFIHNAWNYIAGDYRALQKEADLLERISNVIAQAYTAVSSIEIKKVRSAMDEETYYIGQEIIDAGYANDFEALYTNDDSGNLNRDLLIVHSKMKIKKVVQKCREKEHENYQAEKAVAILTKNNFFKNIDMGQVRGAGPLASHGADETTGAPLLSSNQQPGEKIPAGIKKGGVMNPEELLAQHPDCYQAILALGEKTALEKEQKRVNAHLKMGKESGDLALAVKFIQEGKSIQDDEVHAEYLAAAMKSKNLKNRLEDNPGAIKTEGQEDGADEKDIMNAFKLGFSGKNLKGEE